jgi:hypothetical protein
MFFFIAELLVFYGGYYRQKCGVGMRVQFGEQWAFI